MLKLEQISRQDRDFLRYVYGFRKKVFEEELKFPRADRMVFNEWDALSNHYIVIVDGSPSGSVSVVDWTGLTDVLKKYQIDTTKKVAKITKLAILPEARGIQTLKSLISPVKEEVSNFDIALAEVAPPSNNPSDVSRYQLGDKYKQLFGLKKTGKIMYNGVISQVLSKRIN